MPAVRRKSRARTEYGTRGMPAMRRSVLGGVTQAIVQDLGIGIVTGRFGHTSLPTESELCKTYGAARTILREAVKVLAAKGLITSRPRHGISIAPEDNW